MPSFLDLVNQAKQQQQQKQIASHAEEIIKHAPSKIVMGVKTSYEWMTVEQYANEHDLLPTLYNGLEAMKLLSMEEKEWLYELPVVKDPKLRTVAGKACYSPKYHIRLHPLYFDKHDETYKKECADTFFHELSHIIAQKFYNSPGHNAMWRRIFRTFGFIPKRTYNPLVSDHKNYKTRAEIREEIEGAREFLIHFEAAIKKEGK